MYYRLGLDIGTASVGWCVVETDEYGEPKHIVAMGSRIFDKAEKKDQNGSKAKSPAVGRRTARGARRRLRRRGYRIARAKMIFLKHGVIPNAGDRDVNTLRAEGLDKKLTPEEFAAVLMLLIKRRGFQSTSKAQEGDEDKKLKKALDENAALMAAKGYRTVGEMLAAECTQKVVGEDGKERTIYRTRNKDGDYARCVKREAIRDEAEKLFEAQKGFGNALAIDEVRDAILDVLMRQVGFDEGPGKGSPYSAEYKVGRCTLIPEEERAPKCSVTFEKFVMLQKVNHLRVVSNGKVRALTPEEREKVLAVAEKNVRTDYKRLRKLLCLAEDDRFFGLRYYDKKKKKEDVAGAEKKAFVSFERSREILNRLSEEHRNDEIADGAAYVLSHAKSDDKRRALFASREETKCLTEEEAEALLSLNGSKFGHISVKAAKALIPHLRAGARYDEACRAEGFDINAARETERGDLLKWDALTDETDDITSPVVRRAVSQTIKVLNAVIRKYGAPLAVNVELARDMSNSAKKREEIEKEQSENKKRNDTIRDSIRKEYGHTPTKERVDIYKLYEEQCGKCPYSGTSIDKSRLYESGYVEVDHILPYSRSFDDGFNNKVLVKTKENREKGSRTPFEWLFTTDRWNRFFDDVCVMYANNAKKKANLLREEIDENERKASALNDTRYICRFMLGLIDEHLRFAEGRMGSKRTVAVKGMMTAALRRRWGIGKVREDGDIHHAVDAAVIACVTPSVVNKLSVAYKAEQEEEKTEKKRSVFIAEPYRGFSEELAARCLPDAEQMRERLLSLGQGEEEANEAKPVFVSRVPTRKATGSLHKDTLTSLKYAETEGVVVKKVAITELKLGKDKNGNQIIQNYFHPDADRRTYELLFSKLVETAKTVSDQEKCAKIAFEGGVYKPAGEGKQSNRIKKVKVYEPVGGGTFTNVREGAAGNETMVRVDVFSKDGKYYCVPVYAIDIYKGRLPQKAAVAHKNIRDWKVMDETYKFEFALYKNDLIWIKGKSDITFKKTKQSEKSRMPDSYTMKEGFVYFSSFDISSASMTVITHDNCYERRGLGVMTLPEIRKCTVDVLGNISFVGSEKRPPASRKNK